MWKRLAIARYAGSGDPSSCQQWPKLKIGAGRTSHRSIGTARVFRLGRVSERVVCNRDARVWFQGVGNYATPDKGLKRNQKQEFSGRLPETIRAANSISQTAVCEYEIGNSKSSRYRPYALSQGVCALRITPLTIQKCARQESTKCLENEFNSLSSVFNCKTEFDFGCKKELVYEKIGKVG